MASKKKVIHKVIVLIVLLGLTVSTMAADFLTTRTLATQGNARAQFELAYMYDEGNGVAQNDTKAREWYLKSANQGNDHAQNNIGYMYEQGNGVRQDYVKAKEWYLKSANQGFAQAQFNHGAMYVRGRGVRQSYSIAKELFGRACDNGEQNGCEAYKLMMN